ncbi:MAG: methionyl-tRNA formyltransferase [Alphaproteobacteria bacterium]|jgi:methionyl-tRNA formyltransferase|nr:methionyl-tRNA formyltransferase [Alphaproteobacteria bacterium]
MAGVQSVIFMGSPAFAVPSLLALHQAGIAIERVYTQPPRPAGRGQQLTPTAVHQAALALKVPESQILTPLKLRGEVLDDLLAHPCHTVVVVAYGLLLPKTLVEAKQCLNVHPSALPRWRGAAPLQYTLLAGDVTTEICIMQLDEGMDTGPVFSRTPLDLPPDMSYGPLHDLTSALGAEALVKVLRQLPGLQPTPQTGEAALAPKITAADRVLDFTRPASVLHNQIRALAPAPAATWALPAEMGGETVKVLKSEVTTSTSTAAPGTVMGLQGPALQVACGGGTVLNVLALQRPGREKAPAAEVWRGL